MSANLKENLKDKKDKKQTSVIIRNTRREDTAQIRELCRKVYPESPPWMSEQLESHLSVFPEGQFVAVDAETQRIVGMAGSLVIDASDYPIGSSWREYTAGGFFTNHDARKGCTLYAAEIMVDPSLQGSGVGSQIYAARRKLVARMNLLRIRAGARLRGFHRQSGLMTAREYVTRVIGGELRDETLSFQLKRGFEVIDVASGYLKNDPESMGFAAVIEWKNPLRSLRGATAAAAATASAMTGQRGAHFAHG